VVTTESDRSRRSVFLRLVTWFGNVYLIVFAVDAVFSVVDLALGDPKLDVLASTHPTLYTARLLLALTVIVASVLMAFVLLFVPHLPEVPFLPAIGHVLIGLVLFLVLGAPFQPVLTKWLSIVQLPVAALSFVLVKARTGDWFLSPAKLPRKGHLVARTMFATLATVVVIPLLASAIAVVGFASAIERETGGYLDVTPSGIDVRETVLKKDGRTVVLMAMQHYGEEDFYRTLLDSLPAGSLVLAEGVTDREKRLPAFPSAVKIARMLGLTQQPDLRVRPRAADAASSDPSEGGAHVTDSGAHPEVVLADIDMAELSDVTLAMLGGLANVYDSDSVTEAVRRVVADMGARTTADLATIKHELIDKRNAKVLAAFDDRSEAYSTIMIPWGAMHMPGLEKALQERGYRVDTQRMRTVVRFGTLLGWPTKRP
jgi:hypothetical protein